MKIHFKLPDNKFPLLFFTSLSLILFSLLIVSVSLFSQLDNYKKQVITLNSRIEKLDKENKSLFLKLPQNIEIEEVENQKLEDLGRPSYDCTLTVDKIEDIQPVFGCLFSDITLKDFPINGKKNTIHAIFTQLTNEYDYSLDIFLNDKEVKNNPLAKKIFANDETPSLKYYRFIPIIDDSGTKGLYVFGDRMAQGPIEDIIVINSLGEVVLTDTEVVGVFPEYDPETKTFFPDIKTRFRIETDRLETPEPFLCYSEDQHTPETIVTEFNTYMLVDEKVKHLEKEEITFEEACSEGNENYNPID